MHRTRRNSFLKKKRALIPVSMNDAGNKPLSVNQTQVICVILIVVGIVGLKIFTRIKVSYV